MSQLLINEYLRQLDVIKRVSGSRRESIVREAFKDLLKLWGKQHELVFLAEYPLKTATKTDIEVDGVLMHELRMPLGFWEAKDEDDDLDLEIEKKLRKGYPQDNIVFTDDVTAVLIQRRLEVLRCSMTDTAKLEQLLELFFRYERPEIASFRAAVTQFKVDLPAVLKALRDMIERQERENPDFREASAKFLSHAQEAINPGLVEADVREMLIQHILTEEIFSKVFDSEFHRENNVARELYALENVFFTGALKRNTLKSLEPYYAAIRSAAAQIASHHEKQTFLKVIYENFYKVYNLKAADRLGVVYTPNEVVRFMVDAADWLCEKHFGRNLIDKDVEILDPATGTGTFICELLEHFRGQPKKLEHKYRNELHANEVAILPYYVANLNIEATYAAITGQYEEFPNLCFVDTLDNVGLHTAARGTTAELFGSVSEENVARIKRQNSRRISVVIGNPPYNANQANENDNNKNREYPAIDDRIRRTYIAESNAQKTKLYDMYARFFRWASDRLDANGVLAFVTNRSFVDRRTYDGFRKIAGSEFSEIYVVDLGGDVRSNPQLSGTKHNIFGIQTGVAISLMVKRQTAGKDKRPARVFYIRRPEMETAEEKLGFLASKAARDLPFDELRPDEAGNWLASADSDFASFLPLATKATKAAKTAAQERAVFKTYGNGVSTNRDEWVYDDTEDGLVEKIRYLVRQYESTHDATADLKIKWSRNLKRRHEQGRREPLDPKRIVRAAYRPFYTAYYYDSRLYVDELGIREALPLEPEASIGTIVITDPTAQKPWFTCAVQGIVDLHFVGAAAGAVCLPFKIQADGTLGDNITDWALRQFATFYKANGDASAGGKTAQKKITKEAIFHYCYAVLSDPSYRKAYAAELKREFPRIPLYPNFWRWADWGRSLVALHIGYQNASPWPIERVDAEDPKARMAGHAPKPLLRSDRDAGEIVIDSETTLRSVPAEAWSFQLGSRCAIDWVLEQHKERRAKDPIVREKFDTYRFADHKERVIDLLARVVRVSIETVAIAREMETATRA
jgi:predicted helicase